ncbi:MAG: hypothetical protein GY724_04520 [Actinomycetia bacterium]|nr:hypothetical protein [Actinomycetes bacterium]
MEARTYAFTQFYPTEHESQVRRAYLLLGSPVTAHDVVADAFMAVYQRWDAIAEPGPYLNRCVLNGCRDAQRKGGRERPFRDVADEASVDDGVDEMAELLLDLPFRQPAAIVLRFYGGQSEAEIAMHLECRPGTVGSLIHRGLRSLRRAMEDNHE